MVWIEKVHNTNWKNEMNGSCPKNLLFWLYHYFSILMFLKCFALWSQDLLFISAIRKLKNLNPFPYQNSKGTYSSNTFSFLFFFLIISPFIVVWRVFSQIVLFVPFWSFLGTERNGKIMVSTLHVVSCWPGTLRLTDSMWSELLPAICSFHPPVGTANRSCSN